MTKPLTDAQVQALADALFAGRKIAAIKQYREMTGLGLKEAKDSVEELEASLRSEHPEKFTAPAGKGGCTVGAALIAVTLAGVWYLGRHPL